MRQRNHPYDSVIGYAALAIIVILCGLFWYFFTIGVVVTYDKAQCNRANIGETCVVMVRPEPLL